MRTRCLFFCLFFILGSCVDPIFISPSFLPTIVVEGLITDQPGPYVVKISRAIPVTATAQLQTDPIYESGATVIIKDDQGNSETLTEKSSGYYYTSAFQGVVGRTYSLSIKTIDGSTFESAPEKMLPVGDFSNLRYEFVQNEPPPPILTTYTARIPLAFHHIESKNGFKIFLDSEVLPEQEERIWWRWTGTFKIQAYPEKQRENVEDPTKYPGKQARDSVKYVPDVDLCSGFNDINRHNYKSFLVPIGPCTCCICWVTEYNPAPLISDPKFISNGEITNYNVAFIQANRRTFYEKYYLEVEQLSLSSAIYSFWKNVKIQENNSSTLFQTPPPKTGGNISPSGSTSISVIGYFAASAVKKHSIVMERSNVPYDVGVIDSLTLDCRKAYKYSTNAKPVFW
jgi:hypothetical protein